MVRFSLCLALLLLAVPSPASLPIVDVTLRFVEKQAEIVNYSDPSFEWGADTTRVKFTIKQTRADGTAFEVSEEAAPDQKFVLYPDDPRLSGLDLARPWYVDLEADVSRFLDSHPNNSGRRIVGSATMEVELGETRLKPRLSSRLTDGGRYRSSNSRVHGNGVRGEVALFAFKGTLMTFPGDPAPTVESPAPSPPSNGNGLFLIVLLLLLNIVFMYWWSRRVHTSADMGRDGGTR